VQRKNSLGSRTLVIRGGAVPARLQEYVQWDIDIC
jgi:hypothetical protein